MLPDGYRWIEADGAAYLRHGYGCAAIVRPGQVTINRATKNKPRTDLIGTCGSIEHGKRQVEARLRAQATARSRGASPSR